MAEYAKPWHSIEAQHAADLIDFDRRLRLQVLDAIERIEVSLRMQIAYVLGRISPFAHLDPSTFRRGFTEPQTDAVTGASLPSKHDLWINRMRERQDDSDEHFVAHFREKYDGKMPIWVLTEITELGHLNRLYDGLDRPPADAIAAAYSVPTKRLMISWIASLNYVRNVAAHHARLFNRKLVTVPKRPSQGQVPLLDHMRDATKDLGLYKTLAVMAYLIRQIDPDCDWARQTVTLIKSFPRSDHVTEEAIGVPDGWSELKLWN